MQTQNLKRCFVAFVTGILESGVYLEFLASDSNLSSNELS